MTISKQLAALVAILFGLLLTALKLIIALLTGSLSILAEAIDAVLDLVGTGVTYLAVRFADLPPDDDHPYGHARADSLGALAETSLLVVAALWILWQAIGRILFAPLIPEITLWSFLIILLSLVINITRVIILRRATAQAQSQALDASAANFSIDIIGSVVVLVTLGLIMLRSWLPLPLWFIARADALAAVFVSLLTLYLAWRLGTDAVRALMDDVPPELIRRLRYRILELPDVIPDSAEVRTRFVGEQPYVEVTIGTPRGRSLEEAHQLADDIEQVVRTELEEASVLVHVEPSRTPAEPYATTVYSIAHQLGLRVHNLDLYQLSDCVRVEVDLELPGSMALAEAHTDSERLEAAIQAELPCCTVVTVHLEPRRDNLQPAVHYQPMSERVQQALDRLPDASLITSVETLLTDAGAIVTLHCGFPGDTSITAAHDTMARIENDLARLLPDVARIKIDPEPLDYLEEAMPAPVPQPRTA